MLGKLKRNINIKTTGLFFILMLVFLFLISKTIYTYRQPTITAASPFNGKLTKTEKAKGTAKWSESIPLYINTGGKVEDVFVKEGQSVGKGQKLFTLRFDKEELQQNLKELEVTRSKLQEQISSYTIQTEINNRHIAEASDFEIRQLERDISTAEKDVQNLKTLYEAGSVSQNEYETAQNTLDTLKEQKNEREQERNNLIKSYEEDNALLQKQIAQLALDIKSCDIQKESYQNKLNTYEQETIIYAEQAGELTELQLEKGQHLSDGHYAGKIEYGSTFEISCDVSLENNFIVIGDSCKIKNMNHSFEGTVSKITLTEQAKAVTITVQSDEITTGETFDVTFESESEDSYTLVPNGALNMDNDGYYLNQVKRRDGILGQEYYTQKLRVYIGDSDDTNTVITKGLSFFEPVVLTSNKAFTEGQSVTLNNAGDFFES